MVLGGVIFMMQWMGLLLPCFEKEEDRNARQAYRQIHGRTILWIRGRPTVREKASDIIGGIGNFFRRASSATNIGDESESSGYSGEQQQNGGGGGGASSSSSLPRNSTNKNEVYAKITIRDDEEDAQPEIFIDPLPDQSVGYKLNIALRRIDKVQLDSATSQIVLLAKPAPSDESASPRGSGSSHGQSSSSSTAAAAPPPAKELLRFSVMQRGGAAGADEDGNDCAIDTPGAASHAELMPVNEDERNLLVHHFSVLVEWERQRRSAAGMDDEFYDEFEDQPNFLQARAKKAAHFAKREIELQQTKRERDKRKAQYVAESGGLKYTALAMAGKR